MAITDTETELAIEAEVERIINTLDKETLVPEVRELLAKELRRQIRQNMDPAALLKRKLFDRYTQPDGTISIPEDEREDTALWMVLQQLDHAKGALTAIHQANLSCEHHPIYAGGVEVESHRIFTPKEMALHALEDISKIQLKTPSSTGEEAHRG